MAAEETTPSGATPPHCYVGESPVWRRPAALVPAAQVLRTMPRMRAIAQIINHQTEWWNGSGQPAGLGGGN